MKPLVFRKKDNYYIAIDGRIYHVSQESITDMVHDAREMLKSDKGSDDEKC